MTAGQPHEMQSAPAVLVGVPEVGLSQNVLDWAAAEARSRRLPLQLLCGLRWKTWLAPWEVATEQMIAPDVHKLAEAALRDAIEYVRTAWPDVDVAGAAVDDDPREALISHSQNAPLTVLGTRHLGSVGGVVLGSVSSTVAARGSGAVVVMTGPGALAGEDASVVVGVDTAGWDEDALRFAFDYASRSNRWLRALMCWRLDPLVESQWRSASAPPERADRWLAESLAGWREQYPDVRVSSGVTRDHPVDGLVAASAGQDLLVVGGGTRHPHWGSLLGSVTQGVLHHATCPVAVVHRAV